MRRAKNLTTWGMVVFWCIVVAVVVALLVLGATVARGETYTNGIYRLVTTDPPGELIPVVEPDPWAGIIDKLSELAALVVAAVFVYVGNLIRSWLKRKGLREDELDTAQQVVTALEHGVLAVENGLKKEVVAARATTSNGGTVITQQEAAALRQKAFDLAMQSAASDEARAALAKVGSAAWARWTELLLSRMKAGGTVEDVPAMIVADNLIPQ